MNGIEKNKRYVRGVLIGGAVLGIVLLAPCTGVCQMGDGTSNDPYASQNGGSSLDSFGSASSTRNDSPASQGSNYDYGGSNASSSSEHGGHGGWGGWGGWGNNGGASGSGGQGSGGSSGGSSSGKGSKGGCNDSPENPTLMLAGLAGATLGLMRLRRRHLTRSAAGGLSREEAGNSGDI